MLQPVGHRRVRMVGDEVAHRFVDEGEARVGNDGDEQRDERGQRRDRRDHVVVAWRELGEPPVVHGRDEPSEEAARLGLSCLLDVSD